MDAATRQRDEKLVHVVGLSEGQKVYSVARRLPVVEQENGRTGDVKKYIGGMDRTAPYYVQY